MVVSDLSTCEAQGQHSGAARAPLDSERVPLSLVTSSSLTVHFYAGQLAYLRAAGFDVTVISPSGEELDRITAAEGARKAVIAMAREIEPLKDIVSLWRLWRYLQKNRPAIINFSNPKGGLLGALAAIATGVPCRIYTLRGLRLETTTGLKRWILSAAERLTCRCAQRVICNSESVRRKAVELGLVPVEKTCLLGPSGSRGIDESRFAPTMDRVRRGAELRDALKIPAGVPVIGYAGRFIRDKGVTELINAYVELRLEFPELRLLMLGRPEAADALPESTLEYIKSDPYVICPGFVSNLAEYYQAMDVLALPTYREGFPSVVLEAQAAARPVVTTLATGAIDSVVDGVTGFLVPVGDAKALASALSRILRDGDYAVRLGQAGRERVLREFRHEIVWQSLLDEYKQLLMAKGIYPSPATTTEDGWSPVRAHSDQSL